MSIEQSSRSAEIFISPLSGEEIFCDAIFAISPTIEENEISERLFGSVL